VIPASTRRFGALLFLRFVSPSKLLVSTKQIPLYSELCNRIRSAGKYWLC
jgi:hypothetical protein